MVTWKEPRLDLTVKAKDISWTLNEYTTSQTLGDDQYLVFIDSNGGEIEVTLPKAASASRKIYTIKNVGTGTVTIIPDGTEKIEWEDNLVLGLQGDIASVVTSGVAINKSEWFIIGGRNVKLEDLLRDIKIELENIDDKLRKIELYKQIETKEKVK